MKLIKSARFPDAVYNTKTSLVSARETVDTERNSVEMWAEKVMNTDMVFLRAKAIGDVRSWPLVVVHDIVWAPEEAAKPALKRA
jgi:hypothetical protein